MWLYLKYIMMQEYIIYQLVIKLVMIEEMKEKDFSISTATPNKEINEKVYKK